MKKFIAIMIAISITFSISAPAFAIQNKGNQVNAGSLDNDVGNISFLSSDGDSLDFEIYESEPGVFLMDYFYNGELDTTYTLLVNTSSIQAKTVEGEMYYVQPYVQNTIQLNSTLGNTTYDYSSVWQSLGSFQYYPSGSISVPTIEVSTQIYDSIITTQQVISPAGSQVADVVSSITAAIIAGVLGFVAAPATLAAAVAAALLSDMIAQSGGAIVNNLITTALSDTYTINTLYHYLRVNAPQVSVIKNYIFTSAFVSYNGAPYEYQGYDSDTGFTKENWSTPSFASLAWDDTFGVKGYSYPGLWRVNFYELT